MNFVVSKNYVTGPSMEPGLHTGDHMLALRHKKVKRNDIVVLYAPDEASSEYVSSHHVKAENLSYVGNGKLYNGSSLVPLTDRELYIKRVIGLPGDTIRSYHDKLYVNGKRVPQSYLTASFSKTALREHNKKYDENEKYFTKDFSLKTLAATRSVRVPANTYFVLGDNRVVSHDSRSFGFLPAANIQSVVILRYWPLGKITTY